MKRIGDYIIDEETNYVVGEILYNGSEIKIQMNYWESPDKRIMRIYVERAGEPIGWIKDDLTDSRGKTSTNQTYIDRMIKAMKAAKNA